MVIRYNDVLTIVTTLGDEEKLQVAVKESAKGGLIAGGACAIGGLIFGPVGLALGGTVGGCVAALLSANKFRPVSSVILYDMNREVQQKLIETIQNIIKNLDAGDALEMLAIIQGSPALKAKIISEITRFLHGQMNLSLITNK